MCLCLSAACGLQLLDSLPVVKLDEARLAALGPGAACAVCTDLLAVGDLTLGLPCRAAHTFHPPCVRPWLARTNTCPLCREVRWQQRCCIISFVVFYSSLTAYRLWCETVSKECMWLIAWCL
jgi:hypothetical protein